MDLPRRQILIIEDEAIIAMMLEDAVEQAGMAVQGTVASLAAAMAALAAGGMDVALLDLQLGQDSALPVAQRLQELGIPYVICTGFGDAALPDGLAPLRVLTKPVDFQELREALHALAGTAP
jgi:DNA-binding response OmpR family regulator